MCQEMKLHTLSNKGCLQPPRLLFFFQQFLASFGKPDRLKQDPDNLQNYGTIDVFIPQSVPEKKRFKQTNNR